MIFERVRNLHGKVSPFPLIINLFGSRERLTDAIGSTVSNLPFDYFHKYKAQNRDVPIILVVGHHPAFYMGAQTKLLVNEPKMVGGVLGEPLELSPSKTWGEAMLVPAQAEMVIEAELSTSRYDIEAPFGEYAQYYGGQRLDPVGRGLTRIPTNAGSGKKRNYGNREKEIETEDLFSNQGTVVRKADPSPLRDQSSHFFGSVSR